MRFHDALVTRAEDAIHLVAVDGTVPYEETLKSLLYLSKVINKYKAAAKVAAASQAQPEGISPSSQ